MCGAVSCPTLRSEPFRGEDLDRRLNDQMVSFLASGAATLRFGEPTVTLSRLFLWYGADFVRPQRMPTTLPSRPRRILAALAPWLPQEIAEHVRKGGFQVRFAPYDWGLQGSDGVILPSQLGNLRPARLRRMGEPRSF